MLFHVDGTIVRTVRSLFENYEKFKEWCIGKSPNQIKLGAKLFLNLIYLPLIDRRDVENLDVAVRFVFALDELHLVTGVFQKIYKSCKEIFPCIDNWASQTDCKSQGYHGGVFTGGDVKKMLENTGILYNLAEEQTNFHCLRFVEAFRALNAVRKACFSTKLMPNWSSALADFKRVITALIENYHDIGMTCTLKIHAVIWHVREHCQDQILLNPEEPKGLGFCSTQTGESMHKAFETFFATFHPCWNNVETLCDQLFRAVTKWASLALWPEANASGDGQN